MKKTVVRNVKEHYKTFIFLHFSLLIFSLNGILSKAAAGHPFGSVPFISFYAGALFILTIYAVLWQQVLKRMQLSVAYANRAIVVFWGMLWGKLVFNEEIRPNMIIGAVIIILGILIVVKSDE